MNYEHDWVRLSVWRKAADCTKNNDSDATQWAPDPVVVLDGSPSRVRDITAAFKSNAQSKTREIIVRVFNYKGSIRIMWSKCPSVGQLRDAMSVIDGIGELADESLHVVVA